jgi:WD40 repeat protein
MERAILVALLVAVAAPGCGSTTVSTSHAGGPRTCPIASTANTWQWYTCVISTTSGDLISLPSRGIADVTSPLLFAPDGHTVAIASLSGILLSRIGGGSPLVRIPDSAGSDQLAFSPDGGSLAYTTARHVHIYDMKTGHDRSFPIPAAGSPTFPNQLAWRDDRIIFLWGWFSAWGSGNLQLRLVTIDPTTDQVSRGGTIAREVTGFTLAPNGALAEIELANRDQLLDLQTGRRYPVTTPHPAIVSCGMHFSPDSLALTTAACDPPVGLIDTATGALRANLGTFTTEPTLSLNGSFVAVLRLHGITIWHDGSWRRMETRSLTSFDHADEQIISLSPDGRWLGVSYRSCPVWAGCP